MWQAIKNVSTYGAAVVFVCAALFLGSNVVCCGMLGGLTVIGKAVEDVEPTTTPEAPQP